MNAQKLKDKFAAAAFTALLTSVLAKSPTIDDAEATKLADASYWFADKMLEARSRTIVISRTK